MATAKPSPCLDCSSMLLSRSVGFWAGLMSLSLLPLTVAGWQFVSSSLGTAEGAEQPSAARCMCLLHPGLGSAGAGGVSDRCLQGGC